MNTEKLEKKTEQLLLRSMGAYGYLKVPDAFSEKFNYDRDTVKDPEATLSETDSEARLTFVFDKVAGRLVTPDGTPSIRAPKPIKSNGNKN